MVGPRRGPEDLRNDGEWEEGRGQAYRRGICTYEHKRSTVSRSLTVSSPRVLQQTPRLLGLGLLRIRTGLPRRAQFRDVPQAWEFDRAGHLPFTSDLQALNIGVWKEERTRRTVGKKVVSRGWHGPAPCPLPPADGQDPSCPGRQKGCVCPWDPAAPAACAGAGRSPWTLEAYAHPDARVGETHRQPIAIPRSICKDGGLPRKLPVGGTRQVSVRWARLHLSLR